MRIRLIEPGFERYTGNIGDVNFVDGLSERGISQNQADRIAAVMRVKVESGEGAVGAARLVTLKGERAAVEAPRPRVSEQQPESKPAAEPAAQSAPAPERIYTEEELAQIADAKGIAGLREIGKSYGVKDKSIGGLIREILEAQAQLQAPKE